MQLAISTPFFPAYLRVVIFIPRLVEELVAKVLVIEDGVIEE